jgi:hypothetical protein
VFPHVQEKIRGEGENFLRKSRTVSVLFCSNMTKRKTPQPDYAALASGQSLKSVSRNSSGNLPNPLEVPDSSTGTGMRRKLGQLQAVDLLTLLRNLDPSQRFYNHISGANKVFGDSFSKLLDMRKPSHLMLGQIGPETTKTWIGKLSRGSQALVEWLENEIGVKYDRDTWERGVGYATMSPKQQRDLRLVLTNVFSFVLSETSQANRNIIDKWDGWDHFIQSLHSLAITDRDFRSQPVPSANDIKLATRNQEAERAKE